VILELVGDLIGPEELLWNLPSNIVYHGRKNSLEKDKAFENADIFILPTLSDGFALTQLEAQYWKLPLIVSDRCGDVVINGNNGIVLSDINPTTIIYSIKYLLDQPHKLSEFSENAIDLDDYSLNSIGRKWVEILN
jgi:glycosyltransferase involved in cell wall biosynthesis